MESTVPKGCGAKVNPETRQQKRLQQHSDMEFLTETRILGILLDGVQTILTDKRIKN
jgi:hypothetical protein